MLMTVSSCNSRGDGDNSLDQKIMTAEKPEVDSSLVLEEMELYRAKRYESIQEAQAAGIKNAHKLVLYGRKMGNLSPVIKNLTYLASLDVAFNDLAELPEELSQLHYLQGFYANGNNLTEFPSQILLLPVLAKLDFSDNQISAIPGEISKMDQLTRLTMDNNTLTSIPVQLYYLPDLSVLELSGNGLRVIPEGISNLKKLKKLDLSNNQLSAIPREITAISGTLEELMIQGNNIPLDEVEWLIEAMPETKIRY